MPDFYRRNLPHWIPEGAMYFVTFRLANSLPLRVLQELQARRESEQAAIRARSSGQRAEWELCNLEKKYFGWFDSWLDRCVKESPRWLAEEPVARIVAQEIHALDNQRYRLLAYCIMPNHVHLAIDTAGYAVTLSHRGATASYPLTDTLKLLKGRTARLCNLALGRRGPFWHHESYDHVIRDFQECERIVRYILNNPVRAGLVENWEDWKYSFVLSL